MSAQASPFDARPPSGKQFYCAVFLRWLAGQVCLRLSGILPATLGVIWMVSGPCAVASRLPSRGDRPRSVRDEIRQWRGDNISGPHNTGSGGETPAATRGVGCTVWGEGPCREEGAPALGRMITPRLVTPRLVTPRLGTPRRMLQRIAHGAANMSATPRKMTPRDSVSFFTREQNAMFWSNNGGVIGHGSREEDGPQNEDKKDHENRAASHRAQPFSLKAFSKRTTAPVRYKRNAAPKTQEEIDDLKQEVATLRAELLTFVQTQSPASHGHQDTKSGVGRQYQDTKAGVGRKRAGMYYAGRVFSIDIVD